MARAQLTRLLTELRAAPSPREGEAALARLSVQGGGADAELVALLGGELTVGERLLEVRGGANEPGARRLAELADEEASVVRIARDVYAQVPTSEARVQLLRTARRASRTAVVVHVAVGDENSHLARVLVDAPRRALRALHVPAAEPGDRFGPESFAHCFFDEEALLGELERAGLVLRRRKGFTFVLQEAATGAPPAPEQPSSFAEELVHVAAALRASEVARSKDTPQRALAEMRARGKRHEARGPIGRARLRRAIGWLDALGPGGPSCYRRILLEVALDRGAAAETVVFGLDVGRTGHVAFQDREERTFDVSFAIPPD